MRSHLRAQLAATLLATAFALHGQQPAPPTPAFEAPNLTQSGVRSMAANCASCHGTEGRPVEGSLVAGLAGRSRDELVRLMTEFKSGSRPASLMPQIARGFTDAEIAAMADYFSKLPR